MKSRLIWFLIFTVLAVHARSQSIFKNGDNVCFVGNSITMNGEFHHQIALFYATRFPDQQINVFNSGIGGNSSGDIIRRLSYDVLNHQPNWSVVKLGMNDVNRELYTPGIAQTKELQKAKERQFEIYKRNIRLIIDTLLKSGSRVILQTPTIYDQTAQLTQPNYKGRDDALAVYSRFIKRIAKEYHLTVVDYRKVLLKINKQLQKADPQTTIIGPDRVHPGPMGHFVMASEFLKTAKAPQYVSSIYLDAVSLKNKTVNAEVSEIKADVNSISFKAFEHALPLPVAENVVPALSLVPFIKDFNQQTLRVDHLKSGKYNLFIDNVLIGRFTAGSLAQGINLALYKNTPQYQQALKVLELYQQYWKAEADLRGILSMEYNQLKLRKSVSLSEAKDEYQRLLNQPSLDSTSRRTLINLKDAYLKSKATEPELTAKLSSLRNAIYEINKPKTHRFELKND